MTPRPRSLGLVLCERIIVEEGTGQPSLISVFSGLEAATFPTQPVRFSAYFVLTGGTGSGRIEMRVFQIATGDQIYVRRGRITFPDRTDIVNSFFRIRSIRFPSPGFYVFQIFIDDEPIEGAERRIRVRRTRSVS